VKLTIGLTAALLMCAVTAHAQSPSVGIKAGVNIADLSFSSETEVTDSKNLTGLVAGVFVTVPLNDFVAFQPEALYSRQGTKFTEEGESAKIKLDYLQVPLLGRFKLAKGSPVAVLVGPTLGFRTKATLDVPGAPVDFSDEFEDQIERFDIGLVAGVTADAGRLVLDGRYTWGLRNIAKDESDPGTAKNRVFSATIGVRF
jgi:Outer membrane protein beta-barrel domain